MTASAPPVFFVFRLYRLRLGPLAKLPMLVSSGETPGGYLTSGLSTRSLMSFSWFQPAPRPCVLVVGESTSSTTGSSRDTSWPCMSNGDGDYSSATFCADSSWLVEPVAPGLVFKCIDLRIPWRFVISYLVGGGFGLCLISAHRGICLSATAFKNLLWQYGHSFIYLWSSDDGICS